VLVLAGISNGAFFAERLARHGLVPANAIVLVAAFLIGRGSRHLDASAILLRFASDAVGPS